MQIPLTQELDRGIIIGTFYSMHETKKLNFIKNPTKYHDATSVMLN